MAKEAKRKREAKISHTMLTQDFDIKHWDWDGQEFQSTLPYGSVSENVNKHFI